MAATPRDVQALRSERALQVLWTDDTTKRIGFWRLRTECQCAGCVDERTGRRTLDPRSVPEDISIERMELVGNYAIRIHWTDGHNTGLYTCDRLRAIGSDPQPAK
jgi:DUF971 family protein